MRLLVIGLLLLQVLEETGYDIEALVDENNYIELMLEGKRNKLYIVAGLDPDSAQFAPKCKGVSYSAMGGPLLLLVVTRPGGRL